MAIGTDGEIFGDDPKKDKNTGGRPRLNRELALLLFKAKKSNAQVASKMKCSVKQAGRMRRELIASGKLKETDTRVIDDMVEADFDEECERARGFSFLQWMKNKQPSKGNYIFNFCRKVWESPIWDRASMVIAVDSTDPLADQLAIKFVAEFKEDKGRMRNRLKMIRQLFTFLGRGDINDMHLTMSESNAPREIREVPQIQFNEFPLKLEAAIKEFEEEYGFKAGVWIRMKMTTGIRTGDPKAERGLLGLTTDVKKESYLIFEGDEYQASVLEKKGERWGLNWLPQRLEDELRRLYKEAQDRVDDRYFPFSTHTKDKLSKAWQEIAFRHTGVPDLIFHDLRKVSITYLYAMEIPLEIATSINVGWKDLSTASDHYLQLRRGPLMKRTGRAKYRDNIPEWYKDGLDEFRRDEAILKVTGGRRG